MNVNRIRYIYIDKNSLFGMDKLQKTEFVIQKYFFYFHFTLR